MKRFKVTIKSDTEFEINHQIVYEHSFDCYFQESVKILNVLNTFKTSESEFRILMLNFKMLYKLHYDSNREIPIKVGGTTYIQMEEIL